MRIAWVSKISWTTSKPAACLIENELVPFSSRYTRESKSEGRGRHNLGALLLCGIQDGQINVATRHDLDQFQSESV